MIIQKLKSRVYIGEVGLKDKSFKGQHEAIIDRDLWKQVNAVIEKQAPTRRNPKQKKQHTFILQGLLECGWCSSYLTSKYCTGRGGKLHYYYQCTKNAHGGKDACEMKYVPANKLEKIVLEKIRLLSVDNDFLNQIVLKANESVNDELVILNETKKSHENKLQALKEQIDNIVNAIANRQLQDFKSISERLKQLEEQREQMEKAIETLAYQINDKKQKVFDAEIMHKSLTKFSQVYDKALPEEIKELLPYFVDKITFKPDEIQIALFDQPIEKGLSVNHSGSGAPECIEWLPGVDTKRIVRKLAQHNVVQLLVKMYKYPGRGTTIVFDQPLAARKLPPPKTLKNLITEAMKFHDYLAADPQRTFFDASREFKVTRSWVSQLMKLANNLPTNFLKDMKSCTDQKLIKRFSGKTLMHIAKLKTPQERQAIINELLTESSVLHK